MTKIRTSETDPLRIAELPVGGGVVGITLCPGKQGDSVFGAGWARDLAADVAAIRDWGASAVVTLIEAHEFEMLGVQALPDALRDAGIEWHHLPVQDVNGFLGVAGAAGLRTLADGDNRPGADGCDSDLIADV